MKTFPTPVIMSVVTNRLLCEVEEVQEMLNTMFRQIIPIPDLKKAAATMRAWIIHQYPHLAATQEEDQQYFLARILACHKCPYKAVSTWIKWQRLPVEMEVKEILVPAYPVGRPATVYDQGGSETWKKQRERIDAMMEGREMFLLNASDSWNRLSKRMVRHEKLLKEEGERNQDLRVKRDKTPPELHFTESEEDAPPRKCTVCNSQTPKRKGFTVCESCLGVKDRKSNDYFPSQGGYFMSRFESPEFFADDECVTEEGMAAMGSDFHSLPSSSYFWKRIPNPRLSSVKPVFRRQHVIDKDASCGVPVESFNDVKVACARWLRNNDPSYGMAFNRGSNFTQ